MTSIFENLPVEAASLPKIEEVDFHPIEKKYLSVVLIASSIFWIILVAGWLAFIHFADVEKSLLRYLGGVGVIAFFAGLNVTLTVLGFRKKNTPLDKEMSSIPKGSFGE